MTAPTQSAILRTYEQGTGPDTRNGASARMVLDVVVCRDVAGGTRTIRERGREYLPQAPGEDDDDYKARLTRTDFFNAFLRTVNGLTGMVFRKSPELQDDVPERIVADTEDIDLEGNHLDVFARMAFADAMTAGHGGILVDFPAVDGTPTLAEERALGLRPYWVWYRKEQIISWRTARVRGRTLLTQLVLEERTLAPIDEYVEGERTWYRVLRRSLRVTDRGELVPEITFQVWQQDKDRKQVFLLIAEGTYRNITEIPFVPIYGARKTGVLQSDPPLLDLAWVNVAHYQVRSDHRHAMHKASVPVFVVIGAEKKDDTSSSEIVVGPNTAIMLPIGGDAKYAEHSGSALNATRQELQDLKQEMAVLGLSMLMHETRAAETAEAKRIDKSEQESALATAARGLEDGLEQALIYHAAYYGLDRKNAGSIQVNRDFERLALSAQDIDGFSRLVSEDKLSLETLWDIMQQAGALPDGFDPALELDRIRNTILMRPPVVEDEVIEDDDEEAA